MLLEARHLARAFRSGGIWRAGGVKRAVDDVSFALEEGETLAIVGESGSGKSTTARLVMRLLDPDAGTVHLRGEEITAMSGRRLRDARRHVQMVFQDPFASLNPRMRIGESVGEGLRVHAPELNRRARRDRVAGILERCGMGAETLDRYPHQFSGGQRQRIGIARALVVEPKVLVLDEPVSALDVSVQAQILNLLDRLQREHGLAYLFIAHDLSVVRHVADRVAVMYAGRFVEEGPVARIFEHPRHPYTEALLAARPIARPEERASARPPEAEREGIPAPASGCAYRPRCPYAGDDCASFSGRLRDETAVDGHRVACIHPLDAENRRS